MIKKILSSIAQLVASAPVIGQARSFTEASKNATNLLDPVNATVETSKLIVFACLPPHVKLPAECLIFGLQLYVVVAGATVAAPLTFAASVAIALASSTLILRKLGQK